MFLPRIVYIWAKIRSMKQKQSFLQRRTVKRIDDFCGIKELSNYFIRFQISKPASEKLMILTMEQYFKSLYYYPVPLEDDLVEYRDSAIDTLNYLNEQKCFTDCQYLCFLSDLITYNLKYTSKIRHLA